MSTGDELRALQDVRSILSEFGEEPIRHLALLTDVVCVAAILLVGSFDMF